MARGPQERREAMGLVDGRPKRGLDDEELIGGGKGDKARRAPALGALGRPLAKSFARASRMT